MKAEIYDIEGQSTGKKVDLPGAIFETPKHEHAVYLCVKAQLANMRQGTHATKNRSAVRGGGRKPWRQKGRGVARAGTIRSPLWVGGGRIFGPQPRDYSQKVNKKLKKLARRSVLAEKFREGALKVIQDFSIDTGKTKELMPIVNSLEIGKNKALFLTTDFDMKLVQACNNIPRVRVLRADLVSTYDLINAKNIFVQKGAIAKLEEVLV
ncbi:MAG: 50S ribosomal protein L4 [Calditrichaeota bacterium]|nr:MAG: 50S ribosomal protein L4 [Calditrichota bacterium]